MKIHFWMYNPRNVTKKPYTFGTGYVSRIEPIKILPKKDLVVINGYNFQTRELNNIAVNDGFENWEEMKEFFKKDFFGKVIFWDNCKFNS